MKITNITLITLLSILTTITSHASFTSSTQYNNPSIKQISKYKVDIPSHFPNSTKGLPSGIGSSLTFKGLSTNGDLQFYGLTDRGPNYTIAHSNLPKDTIIFPFPDFSPFIALINISPNQSASLTNIIHIYNNNAPISGIPTPRILENLNHPIPTDPSFNIVSADINGLDPESIDIDHDGNLWIGDEYHPSIIKIDPSSGNILKSYSPGNGLPQILSHYFQNRGFESLAISPNGNVNALLESILNINGQTANSANFIRFIQLNPTTSQTKTFAYLFDNPLYTHPTKAKLGDMAAIDDTHFLIIEQGKTPSGMRNIVYLVDISDATDIENLTLPNGNQLEFANLGELNHINFIKKKQLLNLNDFGWPHEKAEGIAIINDHTIAISNDNDFGFSLSINNTNSEDVLNYHVDYSQKQLMLNNEKSPHNLQIHINHDASTDIWIIELNKPLKDFF